MKKATIGIITLIVLMSISLVVAFPGGKALFHDLSDECQTVVASVAFQYGRLEVATPNFWRQVTTGYWLAALENLRDFGDRYPTRRNKEADLLQGSPEIQLLEGDV